MIDGLLDDEVWGAVEWSSDFLQIRPYDGDPPTSQTSFKILYDNSSLYIAYRCHDDNPEEIVSRMSRRDGFAGDWIEVNIDSYHDKRTAFSFTASVSGVKSDEFVSNDGSNWDGSWNPIWYMKTNIDSLGWTCEVEIPLSQLRYSKDDEQVWGLQFTRRDFRNESRSVWQHIPANAGYWVSGFGELRGIQGISAKRQVEIQPYVVGKLETYEKEDGNPFADGTDANVSVGVDGKIGITSDLTLDFTVNPDFGQVEADPSAITLDGFQIFFDERRPFFIENRNLFQYSISNSAAGGSYDVDNLFYSRRIGAQPHRRVFGYPEGGRYVDQPEFTTILGAAKVSGKTKSGLSIGFMEAVTAQETALIEVNGEREKVIVEPLTNYFNTRLSQDFNQGNTVVGGILTGVHRRINDPSLEFLHKSAITGGLDFIHRWKERAWQVTGNFVFSKVAGTEEAISRTQLNFEHNFDRPDADHLEYDSSATQLTGHGGNIAISETKGKFKFQTGVTWRSPKLELNDIGFMRNTDEINHYYWMGFNENEPTKIFRSWSVNYNHWSRWDFGGKNLFRAVNMNTNMSFQNFWSFGTGLTYENLDISNNWLRGGPSYRKPSAIANWYWARTDTRKTLSFSFNTSYWHAFESKVDGYNLSVTAQIQISDAMNLSVGPNWSKNSRADQYISTQSFNEQPRYILGEVDQRTLSFTMRFNYNITPDLTIQYYGQPFISRGEFTNYNYVLDASAVEWDRRVHLYDGEQIAFEDGFYLVDEDKNGLTDYSFLKPDFDFVQFRSNLVVRWEYIPGSEAYFVWTQGNTEFGRPSEDNLFQSMTSGMFGPAVKNTFLLKLTYRFLNK